ncbi:hypothetical protein VNO78_19987 [Psophocarpus tetragonolobus]|uniref:DUF7651 domain-containing protein n=1 Tax=Psophocarpus tetragonolobus TaxID=3891 RepID=A0AAN9XGR8_PSOTE
MMGSMSDIPESSSSRRPFVPVAGSQRSNQSNRKDNWESLSTEEKVDAENSLALYCRPVELYNIIKARAKEYEQSYDVGPIFTFQGPSGLDGSGNTIVELNFMLPEVEKLAARVNSGKYFLLIFTSAENPISLSTINASPLPVEVASNLCEIRFNS